VGERGSRREGKPLEGECWRRGSDIAYERGDQLLFIGGGGHSLGGRRSEKIWGKTYEYQKGK